MICDSHGGFNPWWLYMICGGYQRGSTVTSMLRCFTTTDRLSQLWCCWGRL